MKNYIRYSFIVILISTILFSCKLKTDGDNGIVEPVTEGTIVLTGSVLSNYSGVAIVNALVKIYSDSLLANGTTNSTGQYSIQVNVIEDTEFTIVVSKDDFISDTTTVFGVMDQTVEVPDIRLIPSTSGTVTFAGTVLNNTTSTGISNAVIKAFNNYISNQTLSDANGDFSLTVTIYEEGEFQISAFKEGYVTDTTTAYALLGGTINIPTFRLVPSAAIEVGSGEAASIYLVSVSEDKLGIKESGDVETATITFEVQDSSGTPIDMNHSVNVELRIAAGPGGGEYIHPASQMTNADGKVTFTINTGTKAGILQVEAKITLATRTIRSLPVFFTIYGGFPVAERFEVACDQLNYPYWGIIGEEIIFTAYIGDKYSNPVRPNTAVYFTTTDGTIGMFNLTDDLGRASSTYLTWGFPDHPTHGPGFFEVTATTVTEDAQIIETSTVRLLSGRGIIYDISPTTFDIPNGGSLDVTFKVSDANGNPLAAGAQISFSVEGGNLKSTMPDPVRLEDTISNGPGITEFSVTIFDEKPDVDELATALFKISFAGPNGEGSVTIYGTTN
ncbi:MAG: hypothetical protein A2V66_01155 [Ignavibacteria bacterium RBG_13_36_8]|nr:MAG: hypothetical protein A2V66_01155 [Ignavibacteria bacterium RBG_13_36_8]